ncbi:GSCFA domain-containing protein [Methylosinus sp. LW3]|uniref:GSCFA domain-containing protein n=1 Tax=Methylosinus sp. LW3 TaxID=107635 RepID=UPI0004AFE830|nr:GSCFA domain-containing protein [Methylosinus sp. LW3]
MKVAILANCNGASIASCIKALNPGFDAQFTLVSSDVVSGNESLDAIADNCDLIFTQPFVRKLLKDRHLKKAHFFPFISFSAYHPDMTFVRGGLPSGKYEAINAESGMTTYQSAIAVFGYVHGLSVDDIISFYNPWVYSRLGYLDAWESSRADLFGEARLSEMPLDAMFERWTRNGCFMYSFNHPHLSALEDIAMALLDKVKIPAVRRNVSQYLEDPLRVMPIWPVYPEIASRYNIPGDYTFIRPEPLRSSRGVMSLREFVEVSYESFARYDRSTIQPLNMSLDFMREKLNSTPAVSMHAEAAKPAKARSQNPYSDIPAVQFWKKSVAAVKIPDLDPVVNPKFKLSKNAKIATAGSCFAQHIARTLSKSGFDYLISEAAPPGMSAERAHELNYGVYSARYGNIYTVRQLVQLLDRVLGKFHPQEDCWERPDGKFVDPLRPQIEPEGFAVPSEVRAARDEHLKAVTSMLRDMDVFIFTLGLTEGWRSRHDGTVYPLAPGVVAGKPSPHLYEFKNFTVSEVITDLDRTVELIKIINPACKIILTVSPVPLIATYEPEHALVATTYSKSVLRVAAEHASRTHENVEYFPSFEIITGTYSKGRYFDDDLRSVTEEGVAHVMGVFMRHYADDAEQPITSPPPIMDEDFAEAKRKKVLFGLVCDEEAIANF